MLLRDSLHACREDHLRIVEGLTITIITTKEILAFFVGRPLLVDKGNPDLDKSPSSYVPVTTGLADYVTVKVNCRLCFSPGSPTTRKPTTC